MSGHAGYEKKTDRTIPVIRLRQSAEQRPAIAAGAVTLGGLS